ncbi:helix-turn-helix domain-containing protein [Lutibacter sp.]|uniref:helix-turn-helix domain-containing protein n=1 Tax=Lutibacter sp. TaxID=1925666 RepID=UPI0035629500
MKKQITQVHNITSEDLKKEIVTDVVTEMRKEFQLLTDNFKQNPPTEFIDSKEACKILGITLPTLFDWRKRNIVPFYQIANKIRFKRADIENSITRINQF